MKEKIKPVVTKSFLLLFLVACSFNVFPVSEDIKLGEQVKTEIQNNPKEYPILNNVAAKSYVQSIVNQIISSPLIKYRSKFAYKVEIINDDKVINAFCTPGGFIYVYTGLLKKIDNEATLAGVLGHEIAHAENRHSTQRMTKAYGASVLTSMVLGQDPGQLEQLGANLLTGLALLKNSRSDELEADEDSFHYLETSKWYPGGIKFFFQKIADNKGSSIFKELLSTHPMPQDRIDQINKLIKESDKAQATKGDNLFKQRYQDFLKSLR
jgi:predicted Zn-dependent protease